MVDKFEIQETLLYDSAEGAVTIEVSFDGKTMWSTQKVMAKLFNVKRHTVNYHLKEIFESGELDEKSTIRKIRIVQNEGGREVARESNFYNLDVIIAVGYRVSTKQGTLFRKWASSILKDYMIKGFAVDIKLLKEGSRFGVDYFDRLGEIYREIRTSERRVYEKITDIYATSYDYKENAKITKNFFANVQNKLHFAVSVLTAPEIISERANSLKSNMGLTTWKDAPKGKILLSDTKIVKNYLNKKELTQLNRIVSMYLDYAEDQAERHNPMSMKDWVIRLVDILSD
jgi:hypothetical protein